MNLLMSIRTDVADVEDDTDSADQSVADVELTQLDSTDGAIVDGAAVRAVTHDDDDDQETPSRSQWRRIGWRKVVTYGVLPALALLLALGAGYFKWQNATVQYDQAAGTDSVRAATDGTVALLSYRPDTVEKDLDAAKSRLTGEFLDTYTSLTRDVVVPSAQQKQITATATVPAAAPISATRSHAVALLFVNQTTRVGQGVPTSTTSTVRVTLDKVDNRWLISQFDPV